MGWGESIIEECDAVVFSTLDPRERLRRLEAREVHRRAGREFSEVAWSNFLDWAKGYDDPAFDNYDLEIRTLICSTDAIESLNARYRPAVRARGHFPTEQAALKCLYLVTRSLDPTGAGGAQWTIRRKPALNAFAVPLRRPLAGCGDLLNENARKTVTETGPLDQYRSIPRS